MRRFTFFVFLGIISLHITAQVKVTDSNLVLFDGYLYGSVIEDAEAECNNIYKRECVFTFSYKFFDKNGKDLFFYINKDQSWDFIPVNQKKENIIRDFQLEILNSNTKYSDPTFYQTDISYIINKRMTITGLIENQRNIWFHPPREYLFKILELNPFPYIKYPFEIGHSWYWKLEIGDAWSCMLPPN